MLLHQSCDSLQAALPCNSIIFTSQEGPFKVGLSLPSLVGAFNYNVQEGGFVLDPWVEMGQ